MTGPDLGCEDPLTQNDLLYQVGLDWIRSSEANSEILAEASWYLSRFAWFHHPGRFADGSVENPLFQAGASLVALPKTNYSGINTKRPRTLHVASEIYSVGGHTRFLAKWIMRDRQSWHHVVLTRQKADVARQFKEIIENSDATLSCLSPNESPLARAKKLRARAYEFDRIVLHTHFDDPIPILAFSAAGGPPVAMFNHAHFGYCLGTSIADVVINTFPYFQRITEQYRSAQRTALLPVTLGLNRIASTQIDKQTAKAKLGIPASAPVIMTIGHEGYFKPAAGYDFFSTLTKIMREEPSLHFIGVGLPSDSQLVPGILREDPRFQFVGRIIDPSPYYEAADLCLESFPFPSLGGLVESVAFGEAFPVPVYGIGESILRITQTPLLEVPFRPTNEAEYVDYVRALLSDLPTTRERGRQWRLSIKDFDDNWESLVSKINSLVGSLTHQPREIPITTMSDSNDCQLLAQLHPSSLSQKINDLLPFGRAVKFHLKTSIKGITRFRDAAKEISARIFGGLTRRLPKRSD
jgi:hypothetical protein